MESKRTKKKSKKRKNDKAKDQWELQNVEPSLLSISYIPDHHSKKRNDAAKKKKHKKNKGKSTLKDESALQPSQVAPPSKMKKLSHKAVVKSKMDTPIKPQRLEDVSKHASKAKKGVHQDLGKAKPRKRVLFDLSPKGSVVQTYGGMSQFSSKTPLVDAGEEHESHPPTVQADQHCEESPRGTDGLHSQDLFITQNTFLSPLLLQLSSDEEFQSTPQLKQTMSQQPLSQELEVTVASKSTAETATQTENFFTSPKHATFLTFQLSKLTKCCEPPVDLSLPHRQRGQRSMATVREESELHHRGKTDPTHINFVQMRLNESFFFKVKGEKESPNSQCPLKKLEEDNGKKPKK